VVSFDQAFSAEVEYEVSRAVVDVSILLNIIGEQKELREVPPER
jgi:hypothetical protein